MTSTAFFLETLEKMGAAPVVRGAHYMQVRAGTRPFRAHTLLARASEPNFYRKLELPVSDAVQQRVSPEVANVVIRPPSSMTLMNTSPSLSDAGGRF